MVFLVLRVVLCCLRDDRAGLGILEDWGWDLGKDWVMRHCKGGYWVNFIACVMGMAHVGFHDFIREVVLQSP